MTRNNGNEIVAALDIGTSKILALVAEINEQSELKVIGCGTEPVSYTHLTLPTILLV